MPPPRLSSAPSDPPLAPPVRRHRSPARAPPAPAPPRASPPSSPPRLRRSATQLGLTCAVCFDLLLEPLTTPCGHSLCEECLLTYLESVAERGAAVGCPQCRQPIPLEPPAVNVALREAIEAVHAPRLAERRAAYTPARIAERRAALRARGALATHFSRRGGGGGGGGLAAFAAGAAAVWLASAWAPSVESRVELPDLVALRLRDAIWLSAQLSAGLTQTGVDFWAVRLKYFRPSAPQLLLASPTAKCVAEQSHAAFWLSLLFFPSECFLPTLHELLAPYPTRALLRGVQLRLLHCAIIGKALAARTFAPQLWWRLVLGATRSAYLSVWYYGLWDLLFFYPSFLSRAAFTIIDGYLLPIAASLTLAAEMAALWALCFNRVERCGSALAWGLYLAGCLGWVRVSPAFLSILVISVVFACGGRRAEREVEEGHGLQTLARRIATQASSCACAEEWRGEGGDDHGCRGELEGHTRVWRGGEEGGTRSKVARLPSQAEVRALRLFVLERVMDPRAPPAFEFERLLRELSDGFPASTALLVRAVSAFAREEWQHTLERV
ncbi:hypothetical protein AB1Y20_022792 [Prymnesium parvum]|uniref:RING-type E3 ubiquitin transferase n=1 Tax=Prymnesium parvum TaxID=97485 RepID=A0AB34JEC6_PRYPA